MSTATVLLISALPADKAYLADALAAIRGQPYRLEVVTSLAEALSRIKHARIDAILQECKLPTWVSKYARQIHGDDKVPFAGFH